MLTNSLEKAIPISKVEIPSVDCTRKWIGQIKDAIQYLNQNSLVWGDAKASNVLINEAGNAILIDFGGGFTDGWVNEMNCEIVEGDLQGLEHIISFINEKIE